MHFIKDGNEIINCQKNPLTKIVKNTRIILDKKDELKTKYINRTHKHIKKKNDIRKGKI